MQAPAVNAYHYIVLYHRHNVSYAHRFNLLIIRIMIGGGREGVIDMYLNAIFPVNHLLAKVI